MPTKSLEITFPPEWENEIIDQKLFFDWLVERDLDGMGGVYPTNGYLSFRIAYGNKELPIFIEDFLESMNLICGLKYERVKM